MQLAILYSVILNYEEHHQNRILAELRIYLLFFSMLVNAELINIK